MLSWEFWEFIINLLYYDCVFIPSVPHITGIMILGIVGFMILLIQGFRLEYADSIIPIIVNVTHARGSSRMWSPTLHAANDS